MGKMMSVLPGQAQGLILLPRLQATCPSKLSPVLSAARMSQQLIKESVISAEKGGFYFPEGLLTEFSSCHNSGCFPLLFPDSSPWFFDVGNGLEGFTDSFITFGEGRNKNNVGIGFLWDTRSPEYDVGQI